jgi:hypothetical protein
MCTGTGCGENKLRLIHFIDEQPIGLYMTLSKADIFTCQGVIMVFGGQRLLF